MRVSATPSAVPLDAVGRSARALGDDLLERLAGEHERGALVRRPAVAELAAATRRRNVGRRCSSPS